MRHGSGWETASKCTSTVQGTRTTTFFGSAPVIGFAVDSFPDVHAAMTAAGTEFIYPEPQRAGGRAWQHFRGPDGNIYEVIGPDDQGA